MSEDLDRRIAALEAEDKATHRVYMALVPDLQPHLEQALESHLEEIAEALDTLYRERDAEWGKNDDRMMRDIANGHNGSEL